MAEKVKKKISRKIRVFINLLYSMTYNSLRTLHSGCMPCLYTPHRNCPTSFRLVESLGKWDAYFILCDSCTVALTEL